VPPIGRLPRGAAPAPDRQAVQAPPEGRVLESGGEKHLTHPYLSAEHPIAIAHRGGTAHAPENTLAAFEHAVGLGYRYLETDVHLTVDGVLVAVHDPDLRRTCGVDAEISAMTAAEVAEARVGGEHPIPLMEELFQRFPDVVFNIDAKSDASVEPLARMVERMGAVDRVCLASFELARIRRFPTLLGPTVMTNMSPAEIASLRVLGRIRGRRLRVAQVPVRQGRVEVVTARFVASAHRQGIPVHVWTVDDPDEMHRLLDLGVDGIMTDRPQVLRDVLLERGIWDG
jgi:glycerophosphoryl diester phosphodiesterase